MEAKKVVGMNAERAKWALAALETFSKETGVKVEADGLETVAGDLLGDLMHLCDQKGVAFSDILESAQRHYEVETGWKCKKCGVAFDAESDDNCTDDLCRECNAGPSG